MEWYIFTQFKRRLRRYKVQRHSSICFQRGFLRNAYATKTLVGTFLRVLWMFLYGDNFASLPTMYLRYPQCVGTCVWVYDVQVMVNCETFDRSPRLVGSHKISISRSSRVQSRQYLNANNRQESFFIPTLYQETEAGLGFAAKATKNALPFNCCIN